MEYLLAFGTPRDKHNLLREREKEAALAKQSKFANEEEKTEEVLKHAMETKKVEMEYQAI